MSTIAVWYLVIRLGSGAVIVPDPYMTESLCLNEAARISRPASEGGVNQGWGHCVKAFRQVSKKMSQLADIEHTVSLQPMGEEDRTNQCT